MRVHCGFNVAVGAGVGGPVKQFAGAVRVQMKYCGAGVGAGGLRENHVGVGRVLFPNCGCGVGVGEILAPAQGSNRHQLFRKILLIDTQK